LAVMMTMKLAILNVLAVSLLALSGCASVGQRQSPDVSVLQARQAKLIEHIAAIERAHLKWLDKFDGETPRPTSNYLTALENRLMESLAELHQIDEQLIQMAQPTSN
jgi:hypothetical protein